MSQNPTQTVTTTDGQWQKLSLKTVWASIIVIAGFSFGVALIIVVGLLLSGVGLGWSLLWPTLGAVALTVFLGGIEVIRVLTTSYRLTEERIERREKFLSVSRQTLSRERIRNVEMSSDIIQRLFGLRALKLATGDQEGDRFALSALDKDTAERLRAELLGDRATATTGTLATFTPGWVRYAPLSLLTPSLGLVAFGVVLQVADWFGRAPDLLQWAWGTVDRLPLVVLALAFLLAVVVIGAIGTAVLYLEGWWNYRLARHDDGSLDLRRGLLVSRSTSFDGSRLRGLTLHEPLGLRRAGGARLDVIAVGVSESRESGKEDNQSPALVPASPRRVSAGVAATILGNDVPQRLRSNPKAARRRRLFRAAMSALGITVVALIPIYFWPGWWWLPSAVIVLSAVIFPYLATDDYRGLGDHIDEEKVTLRKGALFRRSDVLHREGILGWNLKQGPLQRRFGIGTVVATSAGGTGAYALPDVSPEQGQNLMSTAGDVWEHLRVAEA